MYISDSTLDQWLKEDVPYFDLTTMSLEIGAKTGVLEFRSREPLVICGTEEVERMASKLGVHVLETVSSGTELLEQQVFMKISGKAEGLHLLWKVALNIFEYYSGISTRTRCLVDKAKQVNPEIAVATTRKTMPGTKAMSIKAVLCGGAVVHRLGLSETILIFKQHRNFFDSDDLFLRKLATLRNSVSEKKIIVEVENEEQALMFCRGNVDGIQYDKFTPHHLQTVIAQVKQQNPRLVHLAAGGINISNVEEYAACGADVLVTTSVYFSKPVDIGASMYEKM